MEGRYYRPILDLEWLEWEPLVVLEVVQQLVVERGWFPAEVLRNEVAMVLEQEPQVQMEHTDQSERTGCYNQGQQVEPSALVLEMEQVQPVRSSVSASQGCSPSPRK